MIGYHVLFAYAYWKLKIRVISRHLLITFSTIRFIPKGDLMTNVDFIGGSRSVFHLCTPRSGSLAHSTSTRAGQCALVEGGSLLIECSFRNRISGDTLKGEMLGNVR